MKRLTLAIVLAAAALVGAAMEARAQFDNRPFSFQGRGVAFGGGFAGSPSVGMSSAYRQLILERKLLGRPTDNGTFIRSADGFLVNVEQRDRMAFARVVPAPYLAAQGGSFQGGGFGFGAGGVGIRGGFTSGPSVSDGIPSVLGAAPGAVPIDSWIRQLDSLSGPAT